MPFRRFDERIRELCRQVAEADDSNFATVLSELRSALHEHTRHLRNMAIQQLAEKRSINRQS